MPATYLAEKVAREGKNKTKIDRNRAKYDTFGGQDYNHLADEVIKVCMRNN